MSQEYIKVNLPSDLDGYKSGNGEGVWVTVEQEVYDLYNSDHNGDVFTGTIANDSVYYPELKCGDTIVFTMRGVNRPVCVYAGFLDNFMCITAEEKAALIQKIIENQRTGKE